MVSARPPMPALPRSLAPGAAADPTVPSRQQADSHVGGGDEEEGGGDGGLRTSRSGRLARAAAALRPFRRSASGGRSTNGGDAAPSSSIPSFGRKLQLPSLPLGRTYAQLDRDIEHDDNELDVDQPSVHSLPPPAWAHTHSLTAFPALGQAAAAAALAQADEATPSARPMSDAAEAVELDAADDELAFSESDDDDDGSGVGSQELPSSDEEGRIGEEDDEGAEDEYRDLEEGEATDADASASGSSSVDGRLSASYEEGEISDEGSSSASSGGGHFRSGSSDGESSHSIAPSHHHAHYRSSSYTTSSAAHQAAMLGLPPPPPPQAYPSKQQRMGGR